MRFSYFSVCCMHFLKVLSSKAHDNDKFAEFHPKIAESMHKARHVSDQLEQHIDDSIWPLPKYSEILFMK